MAIPGTEPMLFICTEWFMGEAALGPMGACGNWTFPKDIGLNEFIPWETCMRVTGRGRGPFGGLTGCVGGIPGGWAPGAGKAGWLPKMPCLCKRDLRFSSSSFCIL